MPWFEEAQNQDAQDPQDTKLFGKFKFACKFTDMALQSIFNFPRWLSTHSICGFNLDTVLTNTIILE